MLQEAQQEEENRSLLAQVLGTTKDALKGTFVVNIPSQFKDGITLVDKDLYAGKGRVFASNIVYSVAGGDGIEITGGQNPVIVNTDPGSAQNIFKSIRVGNNILSAASNNDTIEFIAGDGLSMDVQNGRIRIKRSGTNSDMTSSPPTATPTSGITTNTTIVNTITNTTVIENTSGLISESNVIRMENLQSSLALGLEATSAKLHIATTSDQVGLVVEGDASHTTNLSEWRDKDGNTLIAFDKEGNATFNGKIIYNSFELKNSNVAFSGDQQNILLDIKTVEPESLLMNGGLDSNLDNWSSSTPTSINQTINPQMTSNLNGWTGTTVGGSFPELFDNTGFETGMSGWNYDSGGITTTSFNLPTGGLAREMVVGPDGNIWVVNEVGRISKVTMSGIITEYNMGGVPYDIIVGPDNKLWYLDYSNANLHQISTNGEIEYTINVTGAWQLRRITVGTDGNIWAISGQGRKVYRINLTGTFTSFDIPDNAEGSTIWGAKDGKIWISAGGKIGTITPSGVFTMYNASWACTNEMTGGVDGNVWYSTYCGIGHGYINSTTGANTVLDLQADMTYGIAAGPDGNMWFTRLAAFEVVRYNPNGSITKIGMPGPSFDIVEGPDRNMWVVVNGDRVVRISLGLATPVTDITFGASAGAIRVNSSPNTTNLSQLKTLNSNIRYELRCNLFKGASDVVNSTIANVAINNSQQSTTFTALGGGWYQLSARFMGNDIAMNYGLRITQNQIVYIDNCSLRQVPERYVTATAYSPLGGAEITAPASFNASLAQTASFTRENYVLSAYVYTDGSAVTSPDTQLSFNGQLLPTTFTLSSTPGWYLAQSSILPVTEGSFQYGIMVKAGKRVVVDDVSLIFSNLSDRVGHSLQLPKHDGSAGAVRINALGTTQITIVQTVTIPSDDEYVLIAHVYNNTPGSVEGPVNTATAEMVINGMPVSGVTYGVATEGFYKLSKMQFLSAGTYTFGVRVNSGYRVVLDSLALQSGTGENKTLNITNSGSGLAFLNVESTTFLHSGRATKQALIIYGAVDQTANLTEWRDNNGAVLAAISKNGLLGIGDSTPEAGLSVIQSSATLPGVSIVNSQTGDSSLIQALRVGLGTQASGTNSKFISFYAGATNETDGTLVGSVRLNNGGVAYMTSGADFAEYYPVLEGQRDAIQTGMIVSLKGGNAVTVGRAYDRDLLGVVSENAGFIGNAGSEENGLLVGLLGQLEVLVSTENGGIAEGDYITTSSIEGYGMKATRNGTIVGTAMESISGMKPCEAKPQFQCGTVRISIKPQYKGDITDR